MIKIPVDGLEAQSLTVCTNDPGSCEAEHKAQGWRLGNLYVLAFYPVMQPPGEHWLYAAQFWRPTPAAQGILF